MASNKIFEEYPDRIMKDFRHYFEWAHLHNTYYIDADKFKYYIRDNESETLK